MQTGDAPVNSVSSRVILPLYSPMDKAPPLTPPPSDMMIGRLRTPWKTILRMQGVVIIAFLLANLLTVHFQGYVIGEDIVALCGGIFSIPLLLTFIHLRRTRLIHVIVAEPSPQGEQHHILPDGRNLLTPVRTSLKHHLLRDSSVLDMPTTRKLWLIFGTVIAISVSLFISMVLNPQNGFILILAILFGIPAWLLGFSIPVFAWWSYSTRSLGLPTRQHEAESVLVAGFISTFPALMINSILFPELLAIFGIDIFSQLGFLLLLTISAPVGEECCKAAAIWFSRKHIDSPRRGFQIGFTIGLGFAMLENLQYIFTSFFTEAGYAGFAFTALVRGIGSIPGHAIWTGLTGLGIGWWLHNKKMINSNVDYDTSFMQKNRDNPISLIDSKTGQVVQDATGSTPISKSVLQIWSASSYPSIIKLDRKKWPLPKTPMAGLLLAILGHAFWNGSTLGVELIAGDMGGTSFILFATLLWTIILISIILRLGYVLLKYEVIRHPSDENS